MSGVTIRADLSELSAASRTFNEGLSKVADTGPLLDEIGGALVTSTQLRFETETGPDGEAWQPTQRGGAILRLTGRLFSSITHAVEPRRVLVGTNVAYASTHQDGATIVPKRAKRLRFTIGSQVIFARKVEIPARPFLGIDAADEREILAIVEDHAEGLLP